MFAKVYFLKDKKRLRMSVLAAWYVAQGSGCGCAKPQEAKVVCTQPKSGSLQPKIFHLTQ